MSIALEALDSHIKASAELLSVATVGCLDEPELDHSVCRENKDQTYRYLLALLLTWQELTSQEWPGGF